MADLDLWDDIILYLYIVEFFIKIVGLGIEKYTDFGRQLVLENLYFDDDWNIFDFIMIIMSLVSNLLYEIMAVLRSAKSIKATRLIRLTKVNRVFKLFRALRTVKIINIPFKL